MRKFNIKKNGFTLIELIIVIIIIGILSGMAIPKFIGVKRDADVAAMFRDIDSLEKASIIYNEDKDKFPKGEKLDISTVSQSLEGIFELNNEDISHIYELDKNEIKDYISNLKYSKSKYLISEKTGKVYSYEGRMKSDNKIYHYYDTANSTIAKVSVNGTTLKPNQIVRVTDSDTSLKITSPSNNIRIKIDNEDVTDKFDVKSENNNTLLALNRDATQYNGGQGYIYTYDFDAEYEKQYNLSINYLDENTTESFKFVYSDKVINLKIDEWGNKTLSEQPFTTTIADKTLESKLFDNNDGTSTDVKNEKIFINNNLIGKTVRIKGYTSDNMNLYIKDKDGNNLNFINPTTGQEVNVLSGYPINGRLIIPEGADHFTFDYKTYAGCRLSTIEVVESEDDISINNVRNSINQNVQTVSFEKSDNVGNVVVYYNNKFLGLTNTNSFSFTIINHEDGGKITLIPISKNYTTKYIYSFNAAMPKYIFNTSLTDKAQESYLFDNNNSTGANMKEQKVYINDTIKSKKLYIENYVMDSATMTIYDKDNNLVPFLNVATDQMVTSLSGYPLKCTILLPESADYIYFTKSVATQTYTECRIQTIKVVK